MDTETTMKVEELLNELVERAAGEVGLILFSLGIEGEFTDDQLALELGIEINEIRKALFAMYEIDLADYVRRRDDETGWMEYYWKINYERAVDVLKRELEKTVKNLREKIATETNTIYYICPNMCVKVSYDEAMDLNFTCPKCGEMLKYLDCSRAVEKIEDEVRKIEEFIDRLR